MKEEIIINAVFRYWKNEYYLTQLHLQFISSDKINGDIAYAIYGVISFDIVGLLYFIDDC